MKITLTEIKKETRARMTYAPKDRAGLKLWRVSVIGIILDDINADLLGGWFTKNFENDIT